jgi:hypothetical protein
MADGIGLSRDISEAGRFAASLVSVLFRGAGALLSVAEPAGNELPSLTTAFGWLFDTGVSMADSSCAKDILEFDLLSRC